MGINRHLSLQGGESDPALQVIKIRSESAAGSWLAIPLCISYL